MDTFFGLVFFAAVAWGVIRLYTAGHINLSIASIFVPFLFVTGFVMLPKPGSLMYVRSDPARKRLADERWPTEALAYHKTMLELEAVRPKAREPFPDIPTPDEIWTESR